MKLLKMKKGNLREFLARIIDIGDFYAPLNPDHRGWKYEQIQDSKSIDLNPGKPLIPMKRFFHPSCFQPIFFDSQGYYPENIQSKTVVFGVHPCDINGTLILDELFIEGEYKDPFYAKRRGNTYIIGLSCVPDETCFCKSTNTHIVEEGFDIFFSDIDKNYIVWVATSKGEDLVHIGEDLFSKNITPDDIDTYTEWHKERDKKFQLEFDLTAIADIMELKFDADFWNDLGEKCLSCGQCTMVCPTCNCFNVVDEIEISEETKGKKKRYWDSCMFENYSAVAGGENFRARRADRVKLWYTHKLQAFNGQYGRYACVGCGRCNETCPVDINVQAVWEHLHGLR